MADKYVSYDNLKSYHNKIKEILESYVKEGDVVTVETDNSLSTTSENPVQNKVITAELNKKANKGDLKTVATSGSYNDLTDKPAIPTVPTKVSAFENDAKYLTAHQDISKKADLVDGKVPTSQLPSYVDDVLEYNAKSAFPTTGETGKIYVDTTTNKTYRWGGSAYVEISASLALGETSSTAYAGDKGKAAYDHSKTTSGNPHKVKYSDLTDKPTLATVATSGKYSDLSGIPSLKTVATSGSYKDLSDKPTILEIEPLTADDITTIINGTTTE
jgi:hypothetical protein